MIMRDFLSWAQTAPAAQRAKATDALARAFLYADLDLSERGDVETILISLTEDPSPLVRRVLAECFASAMEAPRALVLALACDQSDVAAPILSRSPLLTEAELIDCAALGDVFAQSAVALRARVPAGVCAALAEIGEREAAVALAVNPGAEPTEFALRRMVERFGDDGEMREALLGRPWLPASVRCDLVGATAASLAAFAVERGWLSGARAERLARDERDKAHVSIVADAAERDGRAGLREIVRHLCACGHLTPSLVLRALLSGNRDLFEATLTELSGLDAHRIAGLVRDFRGAGFAAAYARAGLPERLLPAFRAALEAQRSLAPAPEGDARLSLILIEHVLDACAMANAAGELDRLMALLRRFAREAAIEEARLERARLTAEAQAPQVALPAPVAEPAARAPLIDLSAFDTELRQAA